MEAYILYNVPMNSVTISGLALLDCGFPNGLNKTYGVSGELNG